MKTVGTSILICACMLSWFYPAFGQSQDREAKSQAAIDCSNVGVDFSDNPGMTREERLEAMDSALQKSLSQYDLCQELMSGGSGANAGSGAGGGGMAGAGSASGSGEGGGAAVSGSQGKAGNSGSAGGTMGGAPVSSIATSDIKGTGTSKSSSGPIGDHANSAQGDGAEGREQGDGVEGRGQDGQAASRTSGDKEQAEGGQGSLQKSSGGGNGAVPEDVKEADNDSVLEAQIREAAMREKDPEVRARLWNEYRRYKGLPQK